MPLTKVCKHCSASVNIRKFVCVCGHVFASKKDLFAAAKPRSVAINIKRFLDSADETTARKSNGKARKRSFVSENKCMIGCILPKKSF